MSALPMAMLVQPFAEPGVGEMGVPLVQLPDVPGPAPLVNHGQSRQQNGSVPTNTMVPAGPIRCDRCKGYINPFCKFVDGGRKFVCSLCQFDNPGKKKTKHDRGKGERWREGRSNMSI